MRSTNVRLPCVPLHQAGVATQALLTLYCLGPLPGYEDEQLLTGRTDGMLTSPHNSKLFL